MSTSAETSLFVPTYVSPAHHLSVEQTEHFLEALYLVPGTVVTLNVTIGKGDVFGNDAARLETKSTKAVYAPDPVNMGALELKTGLHRALNLTARSLLPFREFRGNGSISSLAQYIIWHVDLLARSEGAEDFYVMVITAMRKINDYLEREKPMYIRQEPGALERVQQAGERFRANGNEVPMMPSKVVQALRRMKIVDINLKRFSRWVEDGALLPAETVMKGSKEVKLYVASDVIETFVRIELKKLNAERALTEAKRELQFAIQV